jgi:O-antigen ligase
MQQEAEAPPLLKFSFACFCIFILADYSRFFEWHFTWMHVPLITSALALLGAALEGRIAAVFSNKVGACMAVLTLLYAINVPLSSWKGGSLGVFTGDWLKTLLTFVIAGAVVSNFRQCRTALHCIGFGSGVAGLLVYSQGSLTGGRLSMSKGTLGNANAVAFDLLLGLPFLWLVLTDPRSGKLKKLLAAVLLVICTVVALRTGSRGGLIGFAVLGFLFFLRASLPGKALMAFVGAVLIFCGLAFLPSSLKARYATMFAGSDADAVQQEAINGGDESAVLSAAARRQLLVNSLKLTASHPIFGVGIGQFTTYMASLETAEGHHSGWQGTHNTYTQISSEAGIPALIAFVCMIFFSITGVHAVSKRAKKYWQPGQPLPEVINVAFALDAALIVYAVCVCFDYIAYSSTLPLLAALAIALMRCGNQELDRAEQAQAQQKPSQVINLYPVRKPRVMRPAAF